MLVPGLKKLALSRVISGDENCSRVHGQLCECVRDILAKYRKKQEPSAKLKIKTDAAEKLLVALCKAPKGQREIRENLSSALKLHAEALQGHEHLLSEKGNTYALMEQTKYLWAHDDPASASLLRYHALKNKFLGPDTPLDNKQGKILSEFVKKKDLTLKMLEAIDRDFHSISIKRKQKELSAVTIAMRKMEVDKLKPDSRDKALESVHGISGIPWIPANIPERIYIDIINTMEKTGYHPDERGMCYGIAWVALLACVRQDGQAYMQRMEYLEQMCIPPLRRADTHQVYPFFDTVTLAQTNYEDMSGYSKGIGHPCRQEIAFPGRIIKSHLPDYQVVPVINRAFITECTPETFIEFLKQTQKNNNGIPFGVMIHYPTHVAVIGFDGSHWLAVDNRYHYYNRTTDCLYTFFGELNYFHIDGRIIAAIEMVAGHEHALNIPDNTPVVDAQESVSVSLALYTALQYDDVKVIDDCIAVIGQQAHTHEIMLERLICKNAMGTPGLNIALQKGNSGAIAAFIKACAKALDMLDLSEEEKAKLLCKLFACKKKNGAPGFFITLQLGHLGAITTFIQEIAAVIATLPLPKKQKTELMYELLACKRGDFKPGFYMLFMNDCSEAITAFIQAVALAVATFSDSEKEKTELLYSFFHRIENENKPLFLLHLKKAGPAVQKAFNEGIDQLPLSAAQKETLKCSPPPNPLKKWIYRRLKG